MRYPSVAGRFYPMDKESLIESLEDCFRHPLGPGMPDHKGESRKISAVVCPHAGYSASGMIAAHSFKAIADDGLPEAYIVIGPDHHGVPFESVMCSEDFLTPLGPCMIHGEIASKLRELIPDNFGAHRAEHSIEVQLPFLQFIDQDPHIVPIIMGRQDISAAKRLAEKIMFACEGHDIVIIASSDLSHYVPKDVARVNDHAMLDRLEDRDVEGMYHEIMSKGISACGYGPIATALFATSPSKVEVLKYGDSWDSLRYDPEAVVGYASVKMER